MIAEHAGTGGWIFRGWVSKSYLSRLSAYMIINVLSWSVSTVVQSPMATVGETPGLSPTNALEGSLHITAEDMVLEIVDPLAGCCRQGNPERSL